jgi:intracellular septation protein
MTAANKPQINPMLKLGLDIGPLLLFFVANSRPAWFLPIVGPLLPASVSSGERIGIFVATAVFMAAIVIALATSYALTRHLPAMPLVTAAVVLVFGSLTLLLHDELFIKLKPTIIYLLFGGTLLAGLALGKPLLGMLFDSVFHLNEEGWRKLTLRWALFFFALALINEIVWRTQTTDAWVAFKVFGVLPLTLLFAALQLPLMTRYAEPESGQKPSP